MLNYEPKFNVVMHILQKSDIEHHLNEGFVSLGALHQPGLVMVWLQWLMRTLASRDTTTKLPLVLVHRVVNDASPLRLQPSSVCHYIAKMFSHYTATIIIK